MTQAAQSLNPRNKNGKTNAGIPYRYPKAIKSKALKSSAIDFTVLNKNELKLLELLKKYKTLNIPDLQDDIFTDRNYETYGTSDTRNLLRRLGSSATGCKLIERVPGERGVYRLTDKGTKHLAAFKKSGAKLTIVKTKEKAKEAPAKKKKKPAAKKAKKAPAKKVKKPAAK